MPKRGKGSQGGRGKGKALKPRTRSLTDLERFKRFVALAHGDNLHKTASTSSDESPYANYDEKDRQAMLEALQSVNPLCSESDRDTNEHDEVEIEDATRNAEVGAVGGVCVEDPIQRADRHNFEDEVENEDEDEYEDEDERGITDDEAVDVDYVPESDSDSAEEVHISDVDEPDPDDPPDDADEVVADEVVAGGAGLDTTESDFEGFVEPPMTALPSYEKKKKVQCFASVDDTDFVYVAPTKRPEQFLFNVNNRRPVGIVPGMPRNPKPIDFFSLFVTDEDFEEMAKQTNLYAKQKIGPGPLSRRSRFRKWKPTTADEMKNFLAILIGQGCSKQVDVKTYWSTNYVTRIAFYPETMSRDRFENILSMFHLADNRTIPNRKAPNYSPFLKLGTLYEDILRRFDRVYNPHRELSIDEGTVPWKGRLRFKVYNRNKPKKYGMKAYMMCDATNGYILKFHLYVGKSDDPEYVSYHGRLWDIVMELMKGRFFVGHHVFMDNFYTSPKIFAKLLNQGTDCTGTLRTNRKGVPRSIVEYRVGRGKTKTMHMKVGQAKSLTLVKYHDRKVVYLLSSFGRPDVIQIRSRRNKAEEIARPHIVHVYNQYMGGVDRADQLVSYQSVALKTVKWWKKLFFHIINLALVNAYKLYQEVYPEKRATGQKDFRVAVVQSLIEQVDFSTLPVAVPALSRQSNHSQPEHRLNLGNHYLERHFGTDGSKRRSHGRRCVCCAPAQRLYHEQHPDEMRKPRKRFGAESSFYCGLCDVTLCVWPCFKIYHTIKNFKKYYIDHIYRAKQEEYLRNHPRGPSPPRPARGGRRSTTSTRSDDDDDDGLQD